MAAEPRWHGVASALVVVLLALLADRHSQHHHQFDEPNGALVLAEDFQSFGEHVDFRMGYASEGAGTQALVTFFDLEEVLSSNGCTWSSRSCLWNWWIGTAIQGIGASCADATARIGTSVLDVPHGSMHETWMSSISHCIACSWTLCAQHGRLECHVCPLGL